MTPARRLFAVAASGALGAGGAVRAQSQTTGSTVTVSLSWSEVGGDNLPVPNPNGLLEPGERALLRMSMSFSNQFTIVNFSPPIFNHQSGTIRGFAWAFFDLIGTSGAAGEWNLDPALGFGIAPGWDPAGRPGTPEVGGEILRDIELGQFDPQGIHYQTTNPVPGIWTAEWTPAIYEQRAVGIRIMGSPLAGQYVTGVYVRLSAALDAVVYCPNELGSVSIPIVPAAPSLPVFTIGFGVLRPRRSRRCEGAVP
jgi:hypothetical protein